jgi:hypothetical protein
LSFRTALHRNTSGADGQVIAGKPWNIGPFPLPAEFSMENYDDTYAELHKRGYTPSTQSSPMSLFGGNIGTTSPKYQVGGVIVPRPNTASREGKPGFLALKRPSIIQLAQDAEKQMLRYLSEHDPKTLEMCQWFKDNVPEELRVCGTMFNAMALVGDLRDGTNHIHVDKNDLCSLIIMLGKDIEGGSTRYYDGPNAENPGNIVHEEPFVHGKYQVGPYEATVHDGEPWKGRRGIISFYINRPMYQHFRKYGRLKYDAWLNGNTDDKLIATYGKDQYDAWKKDIKNTDSTKHEVSLFDGNTEPLMRPVRPRGKWPDLLLADEKLTPIQWS